MVSTFPSSPWGARREGKGSASKNLHDFCVRVIQRDCGGFRSFYLSSHGHKSRRERREAQACDRARDGGAGTEGDVQKSKPKLQLQKPSGIFPAFDPPLPKSVAEAIPAWAEGFCSKGRARRSEGKAELTCCPASAAIQAWQYQLVKGRRILPRIVLSRVSESQAPRTSRER